MSWAQKLITMDILGIDKSKENASKIKYGVPRLNTKHIIIVVPPILHQKFLKTYFVPGASISASPPSFVVVLRYMGLDLDERILSHFHV